MKIKKEKIVIFGYILIILGGLMLIAILMYKLYTSCGILECIGASAIILIILGYGIGLLASDL